MNRKRIAHKLFKREAARKPIKNIAMLVTAEGIELDYFVGTTLNGGGSYFKRIVLDKAFDKVRRFADDSVVTLFSKFGGKQKGKMHLGAGIYSGKFIVGAKGKIVISDFDEDEVWDELDKQGWRTH